MSSSAVNRPIRICVSSSSLLCCSRWAAPHPPPIPIPALLRAFAPGSDYGGRLPRGPASPMLPRVPATDARFGRVPSLSCSQVIWRSYRCFSAVPCPLHGPSPPFRGPLLRSSPLPIFVLWHAASSLGSTSLLSCLSACHSQPFPPGAEHPRRKKRRPQWESPLEYRSFACLLAVTARRDLKAHRFPVNPFPLNVLSLTRNPLIQRKQGLCIN